MIVTLLSQSSCVGSQQHRNVRAELRYPVCSGKKKVPKGKGYERKGADEIKPSIEVGKAIIEVEPLAAQ